MDEVTTLAGTTIPLEVAKDRLLVGDSVVGGECERLQRRGARDRSCAAAAGGSTPLEDVLFNAVERGVPLFNWNPEACAAVYVTLEAVVAVRAWAR